MSLKSSTLVSAVSQKSGIPGAAAVEREREREREGRKEEERNRSHDMLTLLSLNNYMYV